MDLACMLYHAGLTSKNTTSSKFSHHHLLTSSSINKQTADVRNISLLKTDSHTSPRGLLASLGQKNARKKEKRIKDKGQIAEQTKERHLQKIPDGRSDRKLHATFE